MLKSRKVRSRPETLPNDHNHTSHQHAMDVRIPRTKQSYASPQLARYDHAMDRLYLAADIQHERGRSQCCQVTKSFPVSWTDAPSSRDNPTT
jgi:phage shock protein A